MQLDIYEKGTYVVEPYLYSLVIRPVGTTNRKQEFDIIIWYLYVEYEYADLCCIKFHCQFFLYLFLQTRAFNVRST